ncbi:MgtE domain-containing protein, partial [Trichostrongylus colubriformis]
VHGCRIIYVYYSTRLILLEQLEMSSNYKSNDASINDQLKKNGWNIDENEEKSQLFDRSAEPCARLAGISKTAETALPAETEPTQASSVRVLREAETKDMEQESTSEIFWQTLIPFLVGGLGSVICGLLVNRAQKTDLVCEVPHLIAICVPLQGMKGNLDMTFSSRLGTMAHQGRLQGSGYVQRILRNLALIEAQGIFISLFAVLITFALESVMNHANHPPIADFLFLASNSLFAMCIASAISSADHESRAAFLILMTSVPFQIIFVFTSHAIAYVALTPLRLNILFLLGYLLTVFIQSLILLYLAQVVVYWLFNFGIDPDLHAIPLLTSIGDLIGTALLFVLFYLTSFSPENGRMKRENYEEEELDSKMKHRRCITIGGIVDKYDKNLLIRVDASFAIKLIVMVLEFDL